jgi:DNA polymerase-3 subunit epsilon
MVRMSACKGFAVLDFETTGLSAARGDRAIEVGIVHVAPDGTLEDEAETLIHVQRDLGMQALHHIDAAELMEAPDFSGIARHLRDLLEYRVFVAHNAAFDSSFLDNEYARLGYSIPVNDSNTICTLKLARRILGVGALSKCCAQCGIDNADAHSALSDAHATAELLGIFMQEDPHWHGWSAMASGAANCQWPHITEDARQWSPRLSHDGYSSGFGTSHCGSEQNQSHHPSTLADNSLKELLARHCSPESPFPADIESETQYAQLLNISLVNAELSVHEKIALAELAGSLGLSMRQCSQIHTEYFRERAQALWEDSVPDETDKNSLTTIGQALSISRQDIEQATEDNARYRQVSTVALDDMPLRHTPSAYRPFTLAQGDHVVLTGSMSRQRGDWEEILRALGLNPRSAVSRRTQVVVAADPDSESTKARKARSYHIPIVDEQWLENAVSDGIDISRDATVCKLVRP